MRFLWPEMLWLLLLIPALVGAYVVVLRRRKRTAVRYASLTLVREAIGPGQQLRRHVPPALFLLAMAAAIVALARPTASVVLPSQYMTIAMAMDVSLSMRATDVEPNRLVAAQNAAKAFIDELPPSVRLGIVSFAGTAAVVQTPTDNKQDMLAAIDRFQLQRATATGSGLILSLGMLFPDDGLDLESVAMSMRHAGVSLDRPRSADEERPKREPVAPGSYTSGVIILLSDGRRTTGPDPIQIAKLAADRGVRVYTVGFGTLQGTTIGFEDYQIYVRLDEETLKAIAKVTGGEYFHAGTAADLRTVYQNLNAKLAMERQQTEVGALVQWHRGAVRPDRSVAVGVVVLPRAASPAGRADAAELNFVRRCGRSPRDPAAPPSPRSQSRESIHGIHDESESPLPGDMPGIGHKCCGRRLRLAGRTGARGPRRDCGFPATGSVRHGTADQLRHIKGRLRRPPCPGDPQRDQQR